MSARKTQRTPVASPPTKPPSSLWIAIALALVTMAVFCPVTRFQFVNYDDTDFVTANPHVQAGLTVEGFKWAWHSEVARNWHPITMFSHMLDCQLFGLQPWWPHFVNLLLHAANSVLLFVLLNHMTKALWRCATVAALFALHPLHVESVAWVAERKDVLSTLFWFLTTLAYVRYVEEFKVQGSKFKGFYALSMALFALGLMSKPMLVTLPFTLLLLDYWPLGRVQPGARAWRLVAEKIPYFLLSAASCVVTYLVQQHGGAMLGLSDFPLGSRVANALISYVRYLKLMFWPHGLAGLYLRSGSWPLWEVALAALFLLTVSVLVVTQRRKRPYLAVGWFWYIGTLVPVIGLVQVGMQAIADRYTYVPLTGIFVILIWGGWEWANAWQMTKLAPVVTAVVLAMCATLTVHQEFYWKDSEALFKRMIDATPNNYMARYNLGNLYSKENRIPEAISNLTAAIEGEPNYAEAHNNLAGIFLEQKRYDDALSHYRTAARLRTEYLYVFNLANALADAASARHDTNEFAEAVQTYRQALQLNPNSSEAHHNLGLTWQAQGRAGEAVAEFEQAVRLNPNRVDTWTQLGFLYATQNKMPESERPFRELIRLQPGNANAYGWLGNALAEQNKLSEAVQFYLTALKLDPKDYKTEFNTGLALMRGGKKQEAAEHLRQALRLHPDYPEAQAALRQLQTQ
jgi:tetratricopeptide (TPR) repeat protein